MASINYATREISCKIVYYGPGLSGKTTNLQIIHRKIPDKDKSEMVSLATETDRTLFFDFLPLDLGSIKGFSTKFQLYTVPGQVYYNATRKLVLRGVDGVVFVVDSQMDKLQENLESFANLQENLREYGHSIENIPLVLQYNKRDLPNVYQVDQLNSLINKLKLPYYEAVAATGVGVFTTLKGIGKSVIDKFNAKYAGFQGTRRPARAGDPAPTAPQVQPPKPAVQPPVARPTIPPQSFPGNFGGAGSGFPNPAGGFGGPANPAPQAPRPNPFQGNTGFPTSSGFPGTMPNFPGAGSNPAPQQAPVRGPAPGSGFSGATNPFAGPASGGFSAPPSGGFTSPGPTGFSNPPTNPFNGPAVNPHGQAPNGLGMPPTPSGFANPFSSPGGATSPGGLPSPGGMPAPKPMGQGGFAAPATGGQGFVPPQGGIPISPFVEGFASGKPGFSGNQSAGGPNLTPPPANPFGAPPISQPPFGQPKAAAPTLGAAFPPSGPSLQGMGGLPGNFQPMPGKPVGGGFSGQPPQPGSAFPGAPGGFGAPPKAPGPPAGGLSQGPFPTLAMPEKPPVTSPSGEWPILATPGNPQAPGNFGNTGVVDKSGIVSTYEDMAKDDSFKTKKLPHPSEKKKGFFDGLFKKDK